MKIVLIAVGRVRGPLADVIAEYETRAGRYYSFDAIEVREQPMRAGLTTEHITREEGARLIARVPAGFEVFALNRAGESWSSTRLSHCFDEMALKSAPGAAFLIGGAFGLSEEVLARARQRLAISHFTLTHEMARLVITEQIYRAGTISRGEPYHKARSGVGRPGAAPRGAS
jgi:23S rRNA (pseudouridine1915-N3)-methyltransferase